MQVQDENGNIVATDNFVINCKICGGQIRFRDGEKQPHRCRIEILSGDSDG